MIGTIRKHSALLWWSIIPLTIISFVWFMSSGPARNGNSGGENDFGKISGHKITRQAYVDARNEFYLYYFINNHEWPDKNPNLSKDELEREIYIRLLFTQKADELGIHVSDEAAATVATRMLASFGRSGQTVTMAEFVQQILAPEGLTAADFERFARHDLFIHQLVQAAGLAGALITPQEAAEVYSREHQEFSAQIVFFSASNYLSQVPVAPAAVAQFYTNYLAVYRLADRVQVSYVGFNVTNYLAQATAEWAKTNFDRQIDAVYAQYGAQGFPDAKTPAEVKVKIRDLLIRQRALADARVPANEFAAAVFNLDPDKPKPGNLDTVAKQKGLAVRVTGPFDSQSGPKEFSAPAEFVKKAFELNPDVPFAGPIVGPDGIYVIALANQLPSEIPPFDQIRGQVTQDYKMEQAVALAQRAGTNFVTTLTSGLAAGKSFASVCAAAGLPPQVLPLFSLSTRELPELGGRVELNRLQQAAVATAVGHASGFEPASDGGFILFVQSQQPVEQSVLIADLPQFTEKLRNARESEAFQMWLNTEANRSLQETPIFRQQMADAAAAK
jgi:hypothetical protein